MVLFEKRGNWKEETGNRARLEREWGRERRRVAYSFPLSFFASPLAFVENSYIRIVFVIKSLENIKRNFVKKKTGKLTVWHAQCVVVN